MIIVEIELLVVCVVLNINSYDDQLINNNNNNNNNNLEVVDCEPRIFVE